MVEEHRLKGTTTVGIVFDKGVVLAADKRATMGTFIASKTVEKIQMVADNMALTTAGGVGDAQALARMLRAELELYRYSKGRPMTVQGASTLLANMLQGHKYYPYFVQLIIGGFDDAPCLFDLDLFGGLLEENYTSTGSGSVVAFGVLDEGYKEKLSEKDAVALATKAVRAAIKRDSATGEGVDVIVITKDNVRRLIDSELPKAA
ncbi:proteasome endopeptidase complex, archaeal, beta subunit [Candidatus Micrarchaeota archaeon CG1_02_55_22]|nr:MAG: proteasome endopeptidase complex, archaeal, beta subunit [Candidatus Micrarchaeota archaeon CG1_02_55_22]